MLLGSAIGFIPSSDEGGLLVGGLIGLIVGGVLEEIIKAIMDGNLGSYSGYRYKFKNKEFMRAFHELNPHL